MSASWRSWLKASIILPVLAVASVTCAYRGWIIQNVHPEDAFFLSLEALTLGGDYKKSDSWRGNGWLEAARLFGLAFYLLTVLKAFGLLLRTQLSDLRAQFARRDLVLVGDHPVLASMARRAAQGGRSVLWLGVGISARSRGVRRVARAWDPAMIRQFRLKNARTSVIAFVDDMAAIDATLPIRRASTGAVIVLPSAADSADAIRSLPAAAGVRIAPMAQPIVRALHESYPPFLAPRAAGQDALHVLIVGRGSTAEAVLADVLLSSLTTFLKQPSITLVAPRIADLEAEIALRQPELARSANIRFVSASDDCDGRLLPAAALRNRAPPPVTNAYVCLDDDRRSLAAAGALDRLAAEEDWPLATIFVHQRGGGDLWRAAAEHGGSRERLMPFGGPEDLARGLGLLDATDDSSARRIHDAYRASATPDAPANVPWNALPEDLREASRRQSAHLLAKLASAGVSLDGWLTARRAGDAEAPLPPFPDLADDPVLLERLSMLEHERWMAERRLSGWRYGDRRDDRRRLHPDLVAFEALSEQSRLQDCAVVATNVKALEAPAEQP